MFTLARQCGVEPLTTSGDLQTLEWIDKLDPVAHKISSGLLSCLPIVEATCRMKKPVLMSTGMSDSVAIEQAVAIAEKQVCPVAIFQCTSEYPCSPDKEPRHQGYGGKIQPSHWVFRSLTWNRHVLFKRCSWCGLIRLSHLIRRDRHLITHFSRG